jgi:hypothetical protein
MKLSTVFVATLLTAKTDFGIFVNSNNPAFDVSVFVVPVRHFEKSDHPITPIITTTG